jgi:hypothetical protein
MQGAQTLGDQKHKEVNVNDSRSPAINVVRTIQYHSNHRRAGRSYAAIVLAQIVRNQGLELN